MRPVEGSVSVERKLPSIQAATRDYERWLGDCLPSVDVKGIARKHKKMRKGPFPFLRGTFYRWMQRWPEIAEDLDQCPRVLAIGDLHAENFGTWRDAEGRLVWGINDFDEAYRLPYSLDLVRLATSVRLGIGYGYLKAKPKAACRTLLLGYRKSLARGGEPVILGEKRHDWMRQLAQSLWTSWDPLKQLDKATRVPRDAGAALNRALPPGGPPDLRVRRAGLGSLGKPRFVALRSSNGGDVAREAKAMTPSVTAWTLGIKARTLTSIVVARAVRAPDPFYATDGGWLLRRLAPDCGKLELDPNAGPPQSTRLLRYMGHETANIHLGTRGARERILADLGHRKAGWLHRASARALQCTIEDWLSWRG